MAGPPTFRAAPAGPFPQQGRSLVGGRQSGCPRDATDEEIVDPPPKGHASPTSPNSILDLENLDHPCFSVYLDRRALRRLAVHLVVLTPGGAQQFAETQMRRAATANIDHGQLPPSCRAYFLRIIRAREREESTLSGRRLLSDTRPTVWSSL